jgi:hypothetical protein
VICPAQRSKSPSPCKLGDFKQASPHFWMAQFRYAIQKWGLAWESP